MYRQQKNKTDNSHTKSKINLREEATKNLKELRVLDCFAGRNRLWAGFQKEKYFGIEKEEGKGKNLNVDNLRVLRVLDLSEFNVIDLDSYGIPTEQILQIYKNPTLKKGTVIIYTYIANGFGGLSKALLNMFEVGEIYRKAKYLETKQSGELFHGFLYNLGVRNIQEYRVHRQPFEKYYGFFTV